MAAPRAAAERGCRRRIRGAGLLCESADTIHLSPSSRTFERFPVFFCPAPASRAAESARPQPPTPAADPRARRSHPFWALGVPSTEQNSHAVPHPPTHPCTPWRRDAALGTRVLHRRRARRASRGGWGRPRVPPAKVPEGEGGGELKNKSRIPTCPFSHQALPIAQWMSRCTTPPIPCYRREAGISAVGGELTRFN